MSYLRTNQVINTSGLTIAGVNGTIVDSYFTSSNQIHNVFPTTTGDGTRIEDLVLSIKPKRFTNIIICEWQLTGEIHQDTCILVHKRGSSGRWLLPTSAGEQGYNGFYGNQPWSGISCGFYDVDHNSTPQSHSIRYSFIANTSEQVDISLALRGGYGAALNRSYGSWGTTSYEVLKSYAWLYEVYN
jgi:hypothetical protein